MSGICGLWDLAGAALPPDPLAPVLARMRRRGPDGTQTWQDGPVALGHASLVTTPEAALERLPLSHPGSGCTITADARIDNREALLTALGAGQDIGDGDLILRAYLRWGEDCVDRLLGDFAFAIWDPRRQVLFCARDHMGVRQLIYTHQPGQLFAFATDARALVTLEAVPKRLNEARVLDFLDGDLESIDDEITPFEGILRLPAAHCLTVGAGGLRLRRYWRLEPGERLDLPSDAAYAEAFTEVFTEAVRCRLRSPETPGSMLSGGMDSGAVAAVAAPLLSAEGRGPLPTFSGTGPDPARVETRLAELASGLPGLAPTFVRHDTLDALLPALRARLDDLDDPFDGHMTIIAAIYRTAAQAGVKVLLDGLSGDTSFSAGNALEAAIREARTRDILRFARHEALETGRRRTFWKVLARAGWGILVPAGIRQRRHARLVRRADLRRVARCPAAPALIRKYDLAHRWARYRAHNFPQGPTPEADRALRMTAPYVTVARERYDRIAAAEGIEPRDPFCDIRLLAFVLSLPDSQLLRDGYRKYILRSAMAGRLPDSIRWNRIRDHHGLDFTRAVFESWPAADDGQAAAMSAARYLFRKDIETRISGSDGGGDLDLRERVVFINSWLKEL